MSQLPDTRETLLLRLRDAGDSRAWEEFVGLYEPAVQRYGQRMGLQPADAMDLSQDVLAAVARAIDRYEPGTGRGQFRAWLYRIARNLTINALTRKKLGTHGAGGTDRIDLLASYPESNNAENDALDAEYRRAVFQRSAELIRTEVQPQTWQAFWRTAVEGRPIPAVADELQLSIGAVYAARSRILARLRREALRWQDEDDCAGDPA